MYDIYDLALLLPTLMLLMYWWRTTEQKSVAVAAARTYCKDRNLQLLDETLVFRHFRLERDSRNKRRVCRTYEFDYSQAGEDRHTGEIILSGFIILRIILHGDVLEITDFQH